MNAKITVLSALLISCNGLSIGTVSENVEKNETQIGDLFPDWVPFKNKHGDELGEFVPVVTVSKVKKRLAPPINFLLRAVAEPEGDDYYDKGAGESDSDDTFESKDWSDLHRIAKPVDNNKVLNHTDISDIDGVVHILTRKPQNSIADAINNARKIKAEMSSDESEEDEREDVIQQDDSNSTTEKSQVETKKIQNSGEEVDYEEDNSEKQKTDPTEDISESEAKKAKILDSVDELKERHAQESRDISEKVKEEELYKEQFERNRLHRPFELKDKYSSRKKYKKITPDYDEYEDKNASLENKYRVNTMRAETIAPTTNTANRKGENESVKLSVFKNPHLYMMYDDTEESTAPNRGKKFSARYTTTSHTNDDNERISLVPEDSKEGEPTLFIAKKRKSKKRKNKTSPAIDSFVAETVTDRISTAVDATASDSRLTDTTAETAPSGSDVTGSGPSGPTAGDVTDDGDDTSATDSGDNTLTKGALRDAVPAPSEHKKEEKSGDFHNEKGGGKEHHSEHEEDHEEHGKKAYEGHHEDTKTAKGHHDKEDHLGKYDDHGGVDKHHSEESGHYGNHHHEEQGKKHAKYEESGKHSKGHSTKGSHDVHKKEEYEKNVEFFEEEGDSAEEEKHGGYNHEREHSEGGKFKKNNLKAGHEHHSKGESGHFGKGGHSHAHKGHKQAAGHDSHGKHGLNNLNKHGHESGKKWVYHHGHPAKTANLVVIDRRGDQYYHGPRYYG